MIGSVTASELISTIVSPIGSEKQTAVTFLPDTGSFIDAVPYSTHQKLFSATTLCHINQRAVPAIGDEIPSFGTFQAKMSVRPTGSCNNNNTRTQESPIAGPFKRNTEKIRYTSAGLPSFLRSPSIYTLQIN